MKVLVGILFASMSLLLADDGQQARSVLVIDDPVLVDQGPVLAAPANAPIYGETILGKPILFDPNGLNAGAIPLSVAPPIHPVPVTCCTVCRKVKCCCVKNQMVSANFDFVDPSGCHHSTCVRVPACCAGEAPQVSWKGRLLGRQVATLCWPCCDHKVKVIVRRSKKVRVRD